MSGRPNVAALVAGLVVAVLGIALVLDAGGEINLEFAYAGPALLAALGVILLVSGLASRGGGRG